MLIGSLIVFINLMLVTGNSLHKKSAKAPFSLLSIPDNLPVEDLQKGLSVLTTDELKTLNKYIDDQSKRQAENFQSKREAEHFQNKRQAENNQDTKNLLGAMENYWTRHVRATMSKKKRNIDDLYDELARDNADRQISNRNNDFSEMEALGCTCRSAAQNRWEVGNMRTKRENQYASNLEKGYSVEEYVRDLENSFPHDQDEREQGEGESAHKNHLRIKRLKN